MHVEVHDHISALYVVIFFKLATDGFVLKCVGPAMARSLTASQRMMLQSTLKLTRDTKSFRRTRQSTSQVSDIGFLIFC